MASNLAGDTCIGELQACVVRAARLGADCKPAGGTDGGIVTAGLVTLTADPQLKEGKEYELENACGTLLFSRTGRSRVKNRRLTGEFGFSDFEMMALLFGGGTILGEAGGDFEGEVIGYYDPLYTDPPDNGVYLEVITSTIEEGSGDCFTSAGAVPVAIGHIYGRCQFTPGQETYSDEVKRLTFTGVASNNPQLYNGPWNDYPGAGYIPNSPLVKVGYTQDQYDAILADVRCGYVDLPVGS